MSESDNIGTTEPTPEPEAKGLRAQLDKAHADLKALREKDKGRAFQDAGFDVDKGLGKAVFKEYDGDMTAEAIQGYATSEYGWEPSTEGDQNPKAPQIALGQAALDQVGNTAGSVIPPANEDVLAKAEAEGDYATTMAIKSQQMADMLKTRR